MILLINAPSQSVFNLIERATVHASLALQVSDTFRGVASNPQIVDEIKKLKIIKSFCDKHNYYYSHIKISS